MRLAKVEPTQAPPFNPATALFALALAGISGAGALAQRRRNRFSLST